MMFKYTLIYLTGWLACWIGYEVNQTVGNLVSIVLFSLIVSLVEKRTHNNQKPQQKNDGGKKNG